MASWTIAQRKQIDAEARSQLDVTGGRRAWADADKSRRVGKSDHRATGAARLGHY
ncbi:MAG: hypothetical protein JWP21_391, partial [Tardiphaga sp.]|nr:hypothetical protein [Tardiphaga sp.]